MEQHKYYCLRQLFPFRRHMGRDLTGQVPEHNEDGTPEQSRAQHGIGVPGRDYLGVPTTQST